MDNENFGIEPGKIYRLRAAETRKILGLANTAIDEAIRRGDLPPPVKLTDGGRATGWIGAQLIELQRKRLAKARRA